LGKQSKDVPIGPVFRPHHTSVSGSRKHCWFGRVFAHSLLSGTLRYY
jgi:hypothetical protein